MKRGKDNQGSTNLYFSGIREMTRHELRTKLSLPYGRIVVYSDRLTHPIYVVGGLRRDEVGLLKQDDRWNVASLRVWKLQNTPARVGIVVARGGEERAVASPYRKDEVTDLGSTTVDESRGWKRIELPDCFKDPIVAFFALAYDEFCRDKPRPNYDRTVLIETNKFRKERENSSSIAMVDTFPEKNPPV